MKIIDELHSKGFDRASAPSMTILSRNEENGEETETVLFEGRDAFTSDISVFLKPLPY